MACTEVPAGQDPFADCAVTEPLTRDCSNNGNCDGSGGCANWPPPTECEVESCTGNTYNAADTCQVGGSCSNIAGVPCADFFTC